jgi:hypothetical protein
MEDFALWFDELLDYADDVDSQRAELIAEYPFMYEDYFEEGLSPEDAYHEEWGC